ncbi:RNA polymerase sigma factor [Anaerosporobacter sp.]|uniref:RNA polymerase sigma factor n=1 Tax=Anaerosporobacter sp. TaxID=1872529 RepID=UPI00286ECE7C|nr:sigma-70 family RNA polymerase sigma factor [Anaerosporobacter sp.]
MRDSTIIKKLKKNSERALVALMEQYISYVIAIATRIGGQLLTNQDIEEVSSDVFYAVWKNRDNLIQTESLKPYIAQITRNMTKKKLVKSRNDYTFEEDVITVEVNDIAEDLVLTEQVEAVRKLLGEFKYPDRDILLAYYFYEFKLEEIAEKFKLPLSTVKSKIYRGKKELVKRFEEGEFYEN